MLSFVWVLYQWVLYILVGMAMYMMYTILIKPYLVMWRYRKYPNVYISNNYYPLLGNFIEPLMDIKAGKVYYDHLRKKSEDI